VRNRYFVAFILAKIIICRQFYFIGRCAGGNVYADQIPRLSGMLVGEMPSNGKLILCFECHFVVIFGLEDQATLFVKGF
jgi:hypothetical protein